MRIKIVTTGLLAFLITLTSCDKYLDLVPQHSLTDANAITDAGKAANAVGGVYATFTGDYWAGSLYTALATKAGFIAFNGQTEYTLSYTQSNPGNGANFWGQFYKSINAANFAVAGITQLSPAAFQTEAAKNNLLAEARLLRGWIYANILWNFGHWWAGDDSPYGILYRDQVASLTNTNQPRISVGESYRKIFEDIDFAIANASEFSSSRYVSKQFAKALKAKLLLYRAGYSGGREQDLKTALDLVNDVLSNHPGALALEADVADVYKNAWDSKELLFGRYLDNDGTRTTKGGYWYTYGSIYQGNKLPLAPGGTLTAGLQYGLDWFKADKRWSIATGEVRAPETWDESKYYTFKKLSRLGSYAGKLSSPPDEKYTAYYLRLSELYLLKAELLYRTGASIASAIAPINQLRAARAAQAFAPLNPSSQQELADDIFKEIFLETCLENGSEFYAALRFKKDGKPWIETIKQTTLVENTICYPIPNAEIQNNILMIQNPGLE
ncbi:RagB/SusD family nutrient uptake outer membrane protein [Niabella sp. CJ426]|uniref:RagB/SusD family nutrient uptake outer membrane protein n=1 Tax=Niabella sp. CJ426 TaxID=3393740 RepID=UPI003CFFE03B